MSSGEQSRVELLQGDAQDLPFAAGEFDRVVSGLMLNFVPDQPRAAAEMARVARTGGEVVLYVWDYAGRMELMRHFWDAAAVVDPQSHEADAGQRFAICKPENLRALYESLNLAAVEVIPIDIQTTFKDFDDYWLPFLGAQGSVSKYLRGLNDETRAALHDQLQQQLPIAPDGTIALMARA